MAVVFPVTSKVLRTKFNTQVAISLSWGVSLLLSSPALFLHGLVESKAADNQVRCGPKILEYKIPVSLERNC